MLLSGGGIQRNYQILGNNQIDKTNIDNERID